MLQKRQFCTTIHFVNEKESRKELWQLKTGLYALIRQLNEGVEHLDDLTSKTIARALGELLQENVSLPDNVTPEELEQFFRETLISTGQMKEELVAHWQEELQPLMQRARERAEQLGHKLADFSPLSVNGEEWGAICIKCLEWVIVTPHSARGALLRDCRGWMVSWK
ncbi:MAG: hypothetical protein H6662_00355 [Ardenticatenaceae bacterium]|nr:hypothetical protein [Anaerolineales bacterium]MCB8920007.1 hypothetical protein [Ardenticatenaceae bacterium]MCB8989852.1 hypothetical protein [Ardenticatenaceae bacterium]